MLFHFQLRDVHEIEPWIYHGERRLHWFGFSDGWYWLKVGDEELLRYTDEYLRVIEKQNAGRTVRPYVDYQVVRLWEDVLNMLGPVFEPVPLNVLRNFSPECEFINWGKRVAQYLDESEASLVDPGWEAIRWINQRRLDLSYVKPAPCVWLWSDGVDLSIHWDNRGLIANGVRVWTAGEGTLTMPVQDFVEEAADFDGRFIEAMRQRVHAVMTSWANPEVRVDFFALAKEQGERARALKRALRKSRALPPTPWFSVLEMMETVR